MGNYIPTQYSVHSPCRVIRRATRGRKRLREETEPEVSDDESLEKKQEEVLRTPKKMKLSSTSNYIYQKLYLDGESSDVTIISLGREWHLHRLYLKQSGYFSSMFQGTWKDSNADTIHMDIPDQNIDTEALGIALGSLYKGDVIITPNKVINILAAATWLSLEGLIQQCVSVMLETISAATVCEYHEASQLYGQQPVVEGCIDWLEKNLMRRQNVQLLKDISLDLMKEVSSSANLFVVHVEMDVYSMMKKWLYLQLNPQWDGKKESLPKIVENFFRNKAKSCGCDFLVSEQGSTYVEVFRCLRLQHIFNDYTSAAIVEEDGILPLKKWLLPLYRSMWLQMLKVESAQDTGPDSPGTVNFDQHCMRVGRVLEEDKQYCWRWTGYNYGIDLVVSFGNRLVLFKRNITTQVCTSAVSLQNKRNILYRLTVTSYNDMGHTVYSKSTGIKSLQLNREEESVIIGVDRSAPMPLHVSCCFLIYTPREEKNPRIENLFASMSNDNVDQDDNTLNNSSSSRHTRARTQPNSDRNCDDLERELHDRSAAEEGSSHQHGDNIDDLQAPINVVMLDRDNDNWLN